MKRERQRAKRRASAFNVFKLMLSLRTLLIMVRIPDYRYLTLLIMVRIPDYRCPEPDNPIVNTINPYPFRGSPVA
jgi:hypothetical protein